MRKLLLALLLVPAVASAGGYSIPNTVPRDLAMADSLVADQTSAGAAYRNPAALARLSGLDLNLSVGLIGNGSTWTNTTSYYPSPVSTDLHLVPPVGLYVSWSGKAWGHGYGIGVGMGIPGGGNVYWPDGWAGRHTILSVDRKVYAYYLSAGFEVIPQVRVGGGFVYFYGTEKLTVDKALPGGQDGLVTLADAGGAPSFDVSLEIQPVTSYPLRIGVDYKQQAYMNLKGPANFAFPPAFGAAYPNQDFTHVLPYPSTWNVGVAWRPVPTVDITAAYTWEGYKAYIADTFVGQTTDPATGQPLTLNVWRNYGNANIYRLGVAWQALPVLEVRGGMLYDQSGVNPAYFNPSLPDAKAFAASVGLGWEVLKNLSIDASFFNAWFETLNSVPANGATQTPPIDNASSFPGSFKSWAWIASLGVHWKWDPMAEKKAN
ncbi:MAG TPA: outer membrane protein transport protein [Anaeromyxobacteraceae bacterium]|nr:outer membrane protein transport protein [Anaeromyxobacteraceae bacterium]